MSSALALALLLTSCGADGERRRAKHDSAAPSHPDAADAHGERDAALAPHSPWDASSDGSADDASHSGVTAPDAGREPSSAPGTPATEQDAGVPAGGGALVDAGALHPLKGGYAVRTVAFARHKASHAGTPIDTVSKAVVLSVAEISESGQVTEQLCALEVLPRERLYGFMGSAGLAAIPPSSVGLVERDGSFVREAADDYTTLGWTPRAGGAACEGPALGSAGCTCSEEGSPPTTASDCRISDPDRDGAPGLSFFADTQRPVELDTAPGLFAAQLVGVKAIEWRLPSTSGDTLRGAVAGGIALWPLGLSGELGARLEGLRSAACPAELGHVELVKGAFTCESLLEARAVDPDTLGIFDAVGDAALPSPTSCSDPDCSVDADGDGTMDCQDACDRDAEKSEAGACGCSVSDADGDADGTADCVDGCPADPAKVAPGSCGCGEAVCRSLLGRYATRADVYLSAQTGPEAVRTWRVSTYSLVSVERGGEEGVLSLVEQPCWSVSMPNPGDGGTQVYGWTPPSLTSASTPVARALTPAADGTFSTATSPASNSGFAPFDCSTEGAPPADWPAGWGASCRCPEDEGSLPLYDRDESPYDCRLTDPDGDGYPGLSIIVATAPPSTPTYEPPPGESARFMLAATSSVRWTVAPAADGRHTGTIRTSYAANIVGCTGAGCPALPASLPLFESCADSENAVQFAPLAAAVSSCSELLLRRESLFTNAADEPWPSGAACL